MDEALKEAVNTEAFVDDTLVHSKDFTLLETQPGRESYGSGRQFVKGVSVH